MSVESRHWQRARHFFPDADRHLHFDHAGGAPTSSRVEETLVRYAAQAARQPPDATAAAGADVRQRISSALSVLPEDVAFVSGAASALVRGVNALKWSAGDRAVFLAPGAPHLAALADSLRRRGIEVETLRTRGRAPEPDALAVALRDPAVRLLAAPSVHASTGEPLQSPELTAACREHAVLLALDASFSLGFRPHQPGSEGVDLFVADGHRGLCAPPGCGVAVTSPAFRAGLVESPAPGDANPFDEVDPRGPGVAALGTAVDLWCELDPAAVAARVIEHVAALRSGLVGQGFACRTQSPQAPFLTVEVPDGDGNAVAARLARAGIRVAARGRHVRLSPHAYQGARDVQHLLEAL
ncbi:MAG: aminotransferase class V-fold PLP-dependent enzyme [Proteobacteria bacterium]|nr:aminotransferase class V-fold PLP-dependent enzyme [Pseudomonadota bacterium]